MQTDSHPRQKLFFTAAIVLSILPGILRAQTATSASLKGAIVASKQNASLFHLAGARNNHIAAKAEETTEELSYFDISAPTYDWYIGADYGTFILISVGERMTLPWSTGYVDSVSFWTDGGNADTMTVGLFSTTVTSEGFLVIDPNAEPIATVDIPVSSNRQDSNEYWTVSFDHVEVPQDFVIGIIPNIDYEQNIWHYMRIRGDRGPVQPLDPETARSVFLASEGTQLYSQHLDSVFLATGETDLIYSNLYMTGYVSQGTSSVTAAEGSQPSISIYPNPASDFLRLSNCPVGSVIRIMNTLGQTVLEQRQTSANDLVNVRSLAAGAYSVLISSSAGVVRTSLCLER